MPWIEANGASLRYELHGDGAPVVLIHEAGGSLESWDAVAPSLQRSHRTLRYDQRGFGMSERTTVLSLEGMVADLRALLAALKLDDQPLTLVGTAVGGSIAIGFAAAHPGLARAVVVSSPVTGDLAPTANVSLEQRARVVESQGMRAVADMALGNSWPVALRTDAERFAQYRGRLLGNDPRSFAALTRAYLHMKLAPLYGRVQCPTLVIGCSDDRIKAPAECARVAAAIARGRFVEAASGHFIAVQAPDLFLQLLQQFMEEPA